MKKTVIMLTIFLTFGFTSSGVLAGSGVVIQGSGDGVTPPDKPRLNGSGGGAFPPGQAKNFARGGNRQVVVYGGGGGVTPPDKPKSLEPTSFCILDYCLVLN